jgi:hypothetical protein
MHEAPTTVIIQRYLDALPGDRVAEPVVRELLERAVGRFNVTRPLFWPRRSRRRGFLTLLGALPAALAGWRGLRVRPTRGRRIGLLC